MSRFTDIAVQVFNGLADGSDGTLDIQGHDVPSYGYLVGGEGEVLVFGSVEDANSMASMRKIIDFITATSARFVGWWTDSDTGKVYVDGTTWFTDQGEAARAARTRREIAFWDIEHGCEIRLVYAEGE